MTKSERFEEALNHLREVKKKEKWSPVPGSGGGSGITKKLGGSNSLSGYIHQDGHKHSAQYPCHNPIKGYKHAEVLWSAFGSRCKEEKVTKYFFNWLCFESPWSKTGIVPKMDSQTMYEDGFVFDNLDKTPANLLHNFLIASRAAAEWPEQIDSWYYLTYELGVDPSFAFFMLAVFRSSPGVNGYFTLRNLDNQFIFQNINFYDWPVDSHTVNEQYIRNFCSGITTGLSETMFYPTAVTTPVNSLWGRNNLTGSKGYVSKIKALYTDIGKEKTSKSEFSGTIKSKYLTLEDVVNIIKLEEARLFLKIPKKKAA